MSSIRVSATALESFRLYMETDWMTEARLIESLTGAFVPTPAVLLGHAYHSVLETPDAYRVPHGYRCEDFSFADATVDPMLALIDRRGVFEVKATRPCGDVTLVARADQLSGARILEFKTTGSFDVDKYLDSAQWRVMALVFEPVAITYHVATLDDHGNGVATLKGAIDSLTVYPYAGLEADVRSLLRDFVAFVETRGIADALREKQRLAEVAA